MCPWKRCGKVKGMPWEVRGRAERLLGQGALGKGAGRSRAGRGRAMGRAMGGPSVCSANVPVEKA